MHENFTFSGPDYGNKNINKTLLSFLTIIFCMDILADSQDKYISSDVVPLAGKDGITWQTKAGDFLLSRIFWYKAVYKDNITMMRDLIFLNRIISPIRDFRYQMRLREYPGRHLASLPIILL